MIKNRGPFRVSLVVHGNVVIPGTRCASVSRVAVSAKNAEQNRVGIDRIDEPALVFGLPWNAESVHSDATQTIRVHRDGLAGDSSGKVRRESITGVTSVITLEVVHEGCIVRSEYFRSGDSSRKCTRVDFREENLLRPMRERSSPRNSRARIFLLLLEFPRDGHFPHRGVTRFRYEFFSNASNIQLRRDSPRTPRCVFSLTE